MALAEVSVTDSTPVLFGKINAAIDLLNALSGEPARAQQAEGSIAGSISAAVGQEASRAGAAERALSTAISSESTARATAIDAVTTSLGAEVKRAGGVEQQLASGKADAAAVAALQASLDASIAALAAGNLATKANATLRPGDAPNLFTSALSGLSPTDAVQGSVVATPRGAVFLLQADAVMAIRQPVWLEPGAFFAVRFVLARSGDADPRAPAAMLGVQWLDALGRSISIGTVRFYPSLRVADGLQVVTARVPSASPDALDLAPPPGAVFFRPFINDLSRGGVLAVSSMTVTDVTNAGVYAPDVSDLAARLIALETRLGQFGG